MRKGTMSPLGSQPLRGPAGFTLIEVMIVVAIVGILAAIALPSYFDYIKRGKIIEGTAGLSDLRQRFEQYFLDNRSYVGGCAAPFVATVNGGLQSFQVGCPFPETVTTYTIQANGVAARGMDLFQYSVDQAGNKVTVGLPPDWALPNPNTCWAIRKNGDCY